MNTKMLSYIKTDSIIHQLTGAAKLIFFILWAISAMITYDTRVLLAMFLIGILVFKLSKVKFKQISFVLYIILFFLLLNNIAIFLFSPLQGVSIYHTRHDLFHLVGPYTVTMEQLFYQLNVTLKYFSVIPMALLFIVTTHPSEFAASLNRIGISYRIAYSVAIALRYIPDIQRDFQDISFAQQARGLDLSKKQNLFKRLRSSATILMPLIFSSLDRIETISCAMELRGFGTNQKRTWYYGRPFVKKDYISLILVALLLLISIFATFHSQSRFYNPFI